MDRILDFADRNLLPLPTERFRDACIGIMKFSTKLGINVDSYLLDYRKVEQFVAHLVRTEDERVAKVELNLSWLAACLGNTATFNQSRGVVEQLGMSRWLITTSLYREPSDGPLTFGEQEVDQFIGPCRKDR